MTRVYGSFAAATRSPRYLSRLLNLNAGEAPNGLASP